MQPTLRKHARVAPAQQPPATSPPPPPADDACTLVLQQVREACSALLNASVSVSADSIRAALSTNLSSSLRRLLASELRPDALHTPRAAAACQDEEFASMLDVTLAAVYTINANEVVSDVVDLWTAVVPKWMLAVGEFEAGQSSWSGPQLSQVAARVHAIMPLLPTLIRLMNAFHTTTGINPLAEIPLALCLTAQMAIILSQDARHGSQQADNSNNGSADTTASAAQMAAVTSLHALICCGPLNALLQQAALHADAEAQQGQALPHSLPALFCAPASQQHARSAVGDKTGQLRLEDDDDHAMGQAEAATPQDPRMQLPIQCYQLWLFALQHLPASFNYLDWQPPAASSAALLSSYHAAAFQALGGSEQLLASCVLSTLDELVGIASHPSHPLADWLWDEGGGTRVMCFLSQFPALPSLTVALLSARGGCVDKKKCSEVLELLRIMLGNQAHMRDLIAACCEVLRPESNCTVDVRVQALITIQTAMDSFLSRLEQEEKVASASGLSSEAAAAAAADRDSQHASCWSDASARVLLFTVMHDPSIRVRRVGMKVLFSLALPQGSVLAEQLVACLLAKMRDKDHLVRECAMDLLIQLPPAMLLSLSTADKAHAMSEGEWAWLLGACLKRLVSGKAPLRFCSNVKDFITAVSAALHQQSTQVHAAGTHHLLELLNLSHEMIQASPEEAGGDTAAAGESGSRACKVLKEAADVMTSSALAT